MTLPTVIVLNPDEYNQRSLYYPFIVSLDGCKGICGNLRKRICVSNKTEDVNLSIFNMITRINESKTLTKHISWKSKCKLHKKCSNDKCQYECKNPRKYVCQKTIFGILVLVLVKMVNIQEVWLVMKL